MKEKRKRSEMEDPRYLDFDVKVRMKEERLQKMLSPLENYIMSFQSILVWEKPRLSAGLLIVVSVLFWCVILIFGTCTKKDT